MNLSFTNLKTTEMKSLLTFLEKKGYRITPSRGVVKLELEKVEKEKKEYGADVNEVIEMFKHINSSYEYLFKLPPQREACEKLLKVYGKVKIRNAILYKMSLKGKEFVPDVLTPVMLFRNYTKLQELREKEVVKEKEAEDEIQKCTDCKKQSNSFIDGKCSECYYK